jgi:uncharacterized membrane protein HdeD (DUF308 family)
VIARLARWKDAVQTRTGAVLDALQVPDAKRRWVGAGIGLLLGCGLAFLLWTAASLLATVVLVGAPLLCGWLGGSAKPAAGAGRRR